MIKKRLLMVAPYPITKPHHGGQKRAKAIFNFYKDICQEAKFVGVFHRGFYQDYAKTDMCLGQPDIIKKLDETPQAGELVMGKAIDNDIHVRSHMAKLLLEFKPEIIHIEQPFSYLGLGPLLKELNLKPKLIFGSQNVEYRMKQDIFANMDLDKKISQPLIQQIKKLEEDFSRQTDLVVAVSRDDAAVHKLMGAKRVVVAPNGIDMNEPTKQAIKHWQTVKKDQKAKKIITFIGSGHPPNWTGFLKMVGEDSTFIPQDSKIVLGGGISEYFKTTYKYGTKKFSKFWSSIIPAGHLSEANLAGLIQSSDVILLPITSGGGSNLKTAEAILSGKKIVATKYAFRGFEKYLALPNIYLAETSQEFKQQIAKALKADLVRPTFAQSHLARQVMWQYCLLPLKKEVRRLSRKQAQERVVRKLKGGVRRAKGWVRKG